MVKIVKRKPLLPERNQNLILFPVVPKFGPSFPLNKLSAKPATQGGKETMNYIYTSNLTLHHAMLYCYLSVISCGFIAVQTVIIYLDLNDLVCLKEGCGLTSCGIYTDLHGKEMRDEPTDDQ